MRLFAAVSLAFVLTFSLAVTAQVHHGSVQIGTAAGSVSATVPPGIHIGNTQFPPFRNNNFRFHHHQFRGSVFAYPYYYGGYGDYGYGDYGPYAWDYSGDYPGYTGYVPGTFDAYSYAPYAGSPYPPQYAPPAYYVSRSAPPPAPSAPQPESYQRQPSNSHQTSEQPAEPTVLVFRDGHREKIANYAIMGSTLFVLSGPRARIPVAELDIPATERVNQDRGIDFKVPKAQ